MPLDALRKKAGKWWPWIENGFWAVVFIVAYIAMQKIMHPGWTIFGI